MLGNFVKAAWEKWALKEVTSSLKETYILLLYFLFYFYVIFPSSQDNGNINSSQDGELFNFNLKLRQGIVVNVLHMPLAMQAD